MQSWTRQKGYPILHVTRNYTYGTINIFQQRYLQNTSIIDLTTWWIPYNFVTANDSIFNQTTPFNWLPQNTYHAIITPTNDRIWSSHDWIVFNHQQTGFYRVLYDDQNYNLIANGLQIDDLSKISHLSRSQLIDDGFSFVGTKKLSYSTVLNLTKYLWREIEYVPWASAIKGFTIINRIFSGNESYPLLVNYLKNLTDPMIKSIGIDDKLNEPHLQKYLRNIAIKWACNYGSVYCRNETQQKLTNLMASGIEFHQNNREVLYCAAIINATQSQYDFVWNRMKKSNDQSYRNSLIDALACTKNGWQLKIFLESSLNNSTSTDSASYRPGENIRIIRSVYQSGQTGLLYTIEYLVDGKEKAYQTIGRGNLVNIVIDMGNYVVSDFTSSRVCNSNSMSKFNYWTKFYFIL